MRGRPNYPESVYAVEKMLLKGFAESPELCQAFYAHDSFAAQLLQRTARALEGGGPDDGPPARSAPSSPRFRRPGQHGPSCGPQCYCLRFQDAPLHAKTRVEGGLWQDSFASKTSTAAAAVVGSALGAAR
mmetsp:Transcript_101954/g.317165  ORF Transcript_101954/g.317165 Transcript_101954/m.317165 type:complete len:130 (+) Transcript_101954:642-1031(+)